MDYRMALAEISELFGTSFAFKGFCVKMSDGTELKIQDAKELNITCGERGVTMTGVIGGIDFSWHMFIVYGMFKVWMDLSSNNEIMVDRIDSIIIDTLVDRECRIAAGDSLIAKMETIPSEPVTSKQILGIYPPEPADEGITFITSVPTKLPSEYKLTTADGRARVIFSTDTTACHEKEVIGEKTCIFNYVTKDEAVEAFYKY